jgi:putative phosphoribosyl transferase
MTDEAPTTAVVIPGGAKLTGELTVPRDARGIVVFATLCGCGRRSAASRWLAEQLRGRAGVGTLLFDLFTPAEDHSDGDAGALRFEVPLLAERLSAATDWALTSGETRHLPIAYYGVGAGAAAALVAASSRSEVRAVVSWAGRPDLAGAALEAVRTPSLLLVSEDDDELHTQNRSARSRLPASELAALPGGGPRGAESDAPLDEIARRASAFFRKHLG